MYQSVLFAVGKHLARRPVADGLDTSAQSCSVRGSQAKESAADRHTRPASRHGGSSDTPATVTSHFESAMRSRLSGSGEYFMYPPPLMGSAFGGFAGHSPALDYGVMPIHMLPGATVAGASADTAKYAEGFEQWYAPYRAQVSGHPSAMAAMTYIHKRDLEQRNHEALVKGSAGALVSDPLSAMYAGGYLPQHHHSHQHTHFHIHPHDQHMRALQAQNLNAATHDAAAAAYQHPGLWHNHPLLWQSQHSHGNSLQQRSLLAAADDHGHVHGLGSTPLDRQLQQQMLLSQQNKQRYALMHEDYLRQWRHDLELKQRLEEAQLSDAYAAGMFGRSKDASRSRQSPSQLDNVVKKSLDSSGAYSSPQKKLPVTIDLSDD